MAYEKHDDALLVPERAVIDEDEQQTVYVVTNDTVQQRAVKTGIRNDGLVEILGGLEDGEQIVITGHTGLRDGAKVLASGTAAADTFTG